MSLGRKKRFNVKTTTTIAFLHSSTAVSSVRLPLPSLVITLGVLWCVAYHSQLLSASSLCHLVMKHSAASTPPRYHFPPFLAAVGHSSVSTPNTEEGELSVHPSVARNTLRLSTRYWARFFSGLPGPGFSPPAIVPNITRRVGRSWCVRCTPPAKRRRRLLVVSTLSHCAFLRALAYDMRSSVRANDP